MLDSVVGLCHTHTSIVRVAMVLVEVPLWVVHSSNSHDPSPSLLNATISSALVVPPADDSRIAAATTTTTTTADGATSLSPPLNDELLRVARTTVDWFREDDDDDDDNDDEADDEDDNEDDEDENGNGIPQLESSSNHGNATTTPAPLETNNNNNTQESHHHHHHHHHQNDDEATTALTPARASSTAAVVLSAAVEPEVHDLNRLVRRKKDGSHLPPSPSRIGNSAGGGASGAGSGGPDPTHATGGGTMVWGDVTSSSTSSSSLRLVATLSAHTGSSVLVVRFSPSGRYLASAGDDAMVCIYMNQHHHHKNTTNSGVVLLSPEDMHWSRIRICRGHDLDVVDLAWAPDDAYLVSCSLDSETPIIVWKTTDLAQVSSSTGGGATAAGHSPSKSTSAYQMMGVMAPFKILGRNIHTSTVRGVSFDPAGSYVASSGDDPAVCIWRAHDDWGLEQRIDASTGIFRQRRDGETTDPAAAASGDSSLFRRLSWSTDGAFLCSTNSVVKNKHVASTICRQGWTVSSPLESTLPAPGAANLVGHRHPVVVTRPAPHLLDLRKKNQPKRKPTADDEEEIDGPDDGDDELDEDDDDDEPEYATLLALGDKRGFVTIWGTHKTRPVFKIQCSEHRVTCTDLAWGRMPNGNLLLLVSMLDGQVVALQLGVPGEIGPLLSKADQARVFQLRYGIDVDGAGGGNYGHRLFVGENASANFIENAVQLSLEQDHQEEEEESRAMRRNDNGANNNHGRDESSMQQKSIKARQQVSEKEGKKRIRPVSMNSMESSMGPGAKPSKAFSEDDSSKDKGNKRRKMDPLQQAIQAADKALTAARQPDSSGGGPVAPKNVSTSTISDLAQSQAARQQLAGSIARGAAPTVTVPSIAPNTDRIYTVDLPILKDESVHEDIMAAALSGSSTKLAVTAECSNARKVPSGSSGNAIPCVDICISQGGTASWRDQILGTSCSALAASSAFLAVGTTDGSLYLFGTSPTMGWSCGNAFRSHPPLIFGHAIVRLQLIDKDSKQVGGPVDILVVTADGRFAVFSLFSELKLQYKGSVNAAMAHLVNSSTSNESLLPRLHRVQLTPTGRLILLISVETQNGSDTHGGNRHLSSSLHELAGGTLQAFLYDRLSELWMRISDSRFVLSDFYSALPSRSEKGTLSRIDDAVRLGTVQTALKPSHRSRSTAHSAAADRPGDSLYEDDATRNFIATRSHCEDRLACAVALESPSEFRHWLSCYAKALAISGQAAYLRQLIDLFLVSPMTGETRFPKSNFLWWIHSGSGILGLDRHDLVKNVILPQISKNRALQRLTNEIALELTSLASRKSPSTAI